MFLNQPVYQLGERQVAQMAALIDRNNKFDMSMNRAAYAQMLIKKTEASRRAIGYDERMEVIQEANFTVEQLKAILSDDTKMAGIPVVGGPALEVLSNGSSVIGMPKAEEQTKNDEPRAGTSVYTDYRSLMSSDNDDQVSVVSEATQRTVMAVGSPAS